MSTPRKKVLWVIPSFQVIFPKALAKFLTTAINTHVVADKYQFSVWVPERELLHTAMNRAVENLIIQDFDAMIVSDDDCLPPEDAIARLLKHYEDGLDVVAGVGYMRGFPHTTTAGRYFPEGATLTIDTLTKAPRLTGFEWIEKLEDEANDLVPVDFCGFPIVMMRTAALKKMVAPWFGTEIDGGGCTHDVYFGRKAQRAGVQIYVDRTIDCGHITEGPVVTGQNRSIKRDLWKAIQSVEALRAGQEPNAQGSQQHV